MGRAIFERALVVPLPGGGSASVHMHRKDVYISGA
jgi:hypothetical protein